MHLRRLLQSLGAHPVFGVLKTDLFANAVWCQHISRYCRSEVESCGISRSRHFRDWLKYRKSGGD
jgi:hypothetical protein